MDTSVTIIGLVITILISIPLYFVFRSNVIHKNKIIAIQKLNNPEKKFNFKDTENQNKKVFSLDPKGKVVLFIDFNPAKTFSKLIDTTTITSCELAYVTDQETDRTSKIELVFNFKQKTKKESITVYDSKFDLLHQICLYEDDQFAKRWKSKIDHCLT
ncbi:hypothetical protein [Flavobacterium sp. TSSA_36]|jgi:hypothetical protein|uniref:hypothetical protein n=1 Tax=Flavobacterium sp. TSSA_36 TaxID=3447669 RepID=UPI003F38B018